jgi:uncharacterized protein (TIGR02246 family)
MLMESTQAGTQEYKPDQSLESSLRMFEDAFNKFDTKAVASCWTEDGTLLTPSGEQGRGRSGVETAYRNDVQTILDGTKSRFTITSVRRLNQDLCFLDLDHELQNCRKPDGTRGTMQLHVCILAKKSGNAWQWLDARPYAFLPKPPSVH